MPDGHAFYPSADLGVFFQQPCVSISPVAENGVHRSGGSARDGVCGFQAESAGGVFQLKEQLAGQTPAAPLWQCGEVRHLGILVLPVDFHRGDGGDLALQANAEVARTRIHHARQVSRFLNGKRVGFKNPAIE